MEVIKAAECCQYAKTDGVGEENLSARICPHLYKDHTDRPGRGRGETEATKSILNQI